VVGEPGLAKLTVARELSPRDVHLRKTHTPTPLAADIRSLLRSLGYTPVAIGEVLAFVEAHRAADGCPSLDADDAPLAGFIVRRHLPALVRTAEVLAAEAGAGYPSAADWPAWCDDFRYTPTAADRSWAAATFEADEAARLGAALDAMADEAEALASLTRGLTAPDTRSPRSRPVSPGCWGDEDQLRHHSAV
jgi:hypothetical protein